MIYVPILKNRRNEMRAAAGVKDFFSESMIPLFEITKENENDYEKIKELLGNNKFFIDFFRFTREEYEGDRPDLDQLKLSLELRDNIKYIKKIKEFINNDYFLQQNGQLIPVISIKQDFKISKIEVQNLISELKTAGYSVSIRIEAHLFHEYLDTVSFLNESDYLLFDIRSSDIKANYMTYRLIDRMKIASKKILLNSPRDRNRPNIEYENMDFTMYINNAVAEEYIDYGFDGFGDFAGLRDKLPESSGVKNGSATAFLYFERNNMFYIVRDEKIASGIKGYANVRDYLLENQKYFDPDNDCLAFKEIKRLKNGNWGSWVSITVIRYIQQINRRLKQN